MCTKWRRSSSASLWEGCCRHDRGHRTGEGAVVDELAPFGLRLRAGRLAARISQEELAERSGVSLRTISNLERGRTLWPHRDTLQRLADALDLRDEARATFIGSADWRPGRMAGSAEPGDTSIGTAAPARADTPVPLAVPRQLPAGTRHFAGRAEELRSLSALLDGAGDGGAVVISALAGTAGVGKTALAVHWAHQVTDRFPDGQLYADLRGWDPRADPVSPAELITRFLNALGVVADQVPPTDGARQDLYRSMLASRRMLIVLDNARDAAQVRPLLPGASGCAVLVTSRGRLGSLVATQAAYPVNLDVLTAAEAHELLERRLGAERLAAEPGEAADLAELCAHLPLALAIAASRAVLHPAMPLASLTAELRDAGARTAALDAGDDVSISAVFSWSYGHLSVTARRVFRLLSVHPGPDISVAAVASLAAVSPGDAGVLVEELAETGLLSEHVPGRYRFHDLLRDYAAERALAEESEPDRQATMRRCLDHYLLSIHAADRTVRVCPGALISQAPDQSAGALSVLPELVADFRQAMAWFDSEREVLTAVAALAVRKGFDEHGWRLAMTVGGFFNIRGHPDTFLTFLRAALAATQRLGDRQAQAQVRCRLSITLARLGAQQDAEDQCRQAMDLSLELDDSAALARAHMTMSVLADCRGRHREALAQSESALVLSRARGDVAFEAVALNGVGWGHAQLGEYERALVYCDKAISLDRDVGDQFQEAHAWDSLGYAQSHLGKYTESVTSYGRALELLRQVGARAHEPPILGSLADAHQAGGQPQLAAQARQRAQMILDELRSS